MGVQIYLLELTSPGRELYSGRRSSGANLITLCHPWLQPHAMPSPPQAVPFPRGFTVQCFLRRSVSVRDMWSLPLAPQTQYSDQGDSNGLHDAGLLLQVNETFQRRCLSPKEPWCFQSNPLWTLACVLQPCQGNFPKTQNGSYCLVGYSPLLPVPICIQKLYIQFLLLRNEWDRVPTLWKTIV